MNGKLNLPKGTLKAQWLREFAPGAKPGLIRARLPTLDMASLPLIGVPSPMNSVHHSQTADRLPPEQTTLDPSPAAIDQLSSIAAVVPGVLYQYTTHLQTQTSRFSYISPKCVELLEIDQATCLADAAQVWAIVHPDDLERIQASTTAAIAQNTYWQDEFRIITASGQEKWIQGQADVPFERTPEVAIHNGIFIDITGRKRADLALQQLNQKLEGQIAQRTTTLEATIAQLQHQIQERQQAEARLQAQEQFLRSVYEGVEFGIFVIDIAPDGELRYAGWNPVCERMTGVQSTAIVGKTVKEVMGDEAILSRQRIGRCIELGYPITYEDSLSFGACPRWFLTTMTPIYTKRGQIHRVVGTSLDITSRKTIEMELHQSRSQVATLLSNLDGMAYSCLNDQAWTMRFISEGCLALTGYHPAQFLDLAEITLAAVIHPDDVERVRGQIAQAIEQQQPFELTYRIRTRDRQEKWVWEKGRAVYAEDGTLQSLDGFITDVTNQIQTEQKLRQVLSDLRQTQARLVQSEKMVSLGQLVAGIAHEINNPIGFIYSNLAPAEGYVQDLLQVIDWYEQTYPKPLQFAAALERLDVPFVREDLFKLLKSMGTGAERIRDIIRSLRNFSRLDEAQLKAVDLHEGIESTLMILSHRLAANRARREIAIAKHYGQLPLVQCYANDVNQVFMHLLSNAIDAIDHRFQSEAAELPLITIRTEPIGEHRVAVRIFDNGQGMDQTVQQYLFDPFYTTKAPGQGTGMGLALSYQIIVERHQGQIRCQSQLGSGSEFIVELPIWHSSYS
jgi:PAS domain S-box-containing protein